MGFGNIGLAEVLVILAVIAVIVGGIVATSSGAAIGRAISGAGTANSWFGAQDRTRAYVDARYAHGVRAGELAELFGLGPRGFRVSQVLALYVALVVADNYNYLDVLSVQYWSSSLLAVLSPAMFLVAAIAAVRSFQGVIAVALATGVLYSIASLVVRYGVAAVMSVGSDSQRETSAVATFLWPALTMIALQIGVWGSARWLRILIALLLASLIQRAVFVVLQGGNLQYLVESPSALLVNNVLWTLGFWAAQQFFGERAYRAGQPSTIPRGVPNKRDAGLGFTERLIPLAFLGASIAALVWAL